MTSNDVLSEVIDAAEETKANAHAAFLSLARQIVDGETPSPDHVREVLDGDGKKVEDLRKCVDVMRRRRQLVDTMAKEPEAKRESLAIEEKIKAAENEFDKAKQKFLSTVNGLRWEQAQLGQRVTQAGYAQRELRDTFQNETAIQREAQLLERRIELSRQVTKQKELVWSATIKAEKARKQAGEAKHKPQWTDDYRNAQSLLSLAETSEKEAANRKSRLLEPQQELQELDRELGEIAAMKMEE